MKKIEKEDKNKDNLNSKNEKENNSKKKYLIILLLLLLICIFGISITFGKDIYENIENQIIETFKLDKPTSPVIDGGSNDWKKESIIKVVKDAYTKNGLDYYEYCISENKSTKKCNFKKTETKNVKISLTGKYYVTFRAVDKKGNKGNLSNTEVVFIDNQNPVITNVVEKKITTNSIQVEVSAKDEHSGIEGYYYSIDGSTYEKGKSTYTYSNLEIGKEYTIYVKVVDKVGNITVLSMQVKTKENDNEITPNPTDSPNPTESPLPTDNGNGGSSTTPSPTTTPAPDDEKDLVIPIINLDKVPSNFIYGSKYDLPSYYEFGPTGGTVKCLVDNIEMTDTSSLGIGEHNIECTAYGNNGINVRVTKKIKVEVAEGLDEEWDGWIRLNLYYPDNSINWQWRIGKEGEIRDGYENTGWQDYTGPILVKLDDVKDVYIRYDLLGETYVIAPSGKAAVDIEPDKYTIKNNEKTKVKIYYDKDAEVKEYRVSSGNWQDYTGEFEVGVNTLIEARVVKEEKVYNSDGEYLYSKKVKGTDSVFISELLANDEEEWNQKINSGYTGTGTSEGGSTGTFDYLPSKKNDGVYTTIPSTNTKPSEYLIGPNIKVTPSDTKAENVKVSIEPQEEADVIYVQEGSSGSYKVYTGEFTVGKNELIKAYYVRKSDGKVSDTSYKWIQNIIVGNKPYVRIDATPDYLSSKQTEVTVTISGDNYNTLEYSFDGVIYQNYTGEIKVQKSSTIYARGINQNGQTVVSRVITTVTSPTPTKKLDVEIFTDPEASNTLVNKTVVTIDYDKDAVGKYYKLQGDTNYKQYTGPFVVNQNTTVYAYATSTNGYGSKTLGIDFLTTGIMAPVITYEPSSVANMVTVSITFDKNADQKYYQIDGGAKLYYTEPFEIYQNSEIYAYNSNVLGYTADATENITNIQPLPKYIVIDKDSYYIIKLNYPSCATIREYKWQVNGVWKTYDDKGILLIKPQYQNQFNMNGYNGIKVKDENGNDVIFTDHYYLINVPFSELMENLFMRWDKTKPKSPEIIVEPSDEEAKEVTVSINYNKILTNRYYKIVDANGIATDWIEYTKSFKVKQNGTIIYAKGETKSEIQSDTVSKKITNIDDVAPVITVNGDLINPKQKVNLMVSAKDNYFVDTVKWAKGSQNSSYFQKNGTEIDNSSIVTIEENGVYTFYAVDRVGNESVVEVEVTNIDKEAPNVVINIVATKKTTKTKVNIDYGDSTIKQYKIGENGTYQDYTGEFLLEAENLYHLKNEDGSLTIYAKGLDAASNETIVSERTYVLDLDKISEPIITLSDGYPMLTNLGMIEEKPSYIVYDTTKDDIENYYRIDGGDWKKYTGPITIKTGKIEAKSVRKETGQEVITVGEVKVPSNAVNSVTYDDDLTNKETIGKNQVRLFTLNPNLYGRKIKIYTGTTVANNAEIRLYDKDKNLLTKTNMVKVLSMIEVVDNAYYVEISSGSSSLDVREISLQTEKTIYEEYTPMIEINDSKWTAEKIVTISYYSNEYVNEYSINNGVTWLEYDGPVKLIEPTIIMARTTRDDIVLGASSFDITKIDAKEPVIELNIPSRIQLGYDLQVPTYYKETASGVTVECKDGDTVITNISELKLGTHKIQCVSTTGTGKKATVEKEITVIETSDITANSLLEAISSEEIITGKYKIQVNDEIYPVHMIVLDGDQHFTENQTFGDSKDVATKDDYAQNMVIVKVNGNLTIDSRVTVGPYYDESYGGPKGFTIYVTGKLTNNGTIDNSHGAKAEGQNVYLWKNSDGTYEYVPAVGGTGAASAKACDSNHSTAGNSAVAATGRQTGGGGSGYVTSPGGAGGLCSYSGTGGIGTSYSGGPGSGGIYASNTRGSSASSVGGSGGIGIGRENGVGNPAGGTGGLLIIYANEYENNGTISAKGTDTSSYGGASGGGSINLFYLNLISAGNVSVVGGSRSSGGAGGTGTVTYTQLEPIMITSNYTYSNLTSEGFTYEQNVVTIYYSSIIAKKLYSIDDGTTWIEYNKPFTVSNGTKVLAKGVNKDNSETEIVSYEVPLEDGVPYNIVDGDISTSSTLNENTNYVFTVSNDTIGKSLRFFLNGEVASDASIKIYDKNDSELLSTTFVSNLTVINIPENAYKFIINPGSNTLTITEINLRTNVIKDNSPSIEINDVNWTVNKTIDITYPEGYRNEYSLDLGETWIEYLSPITVEKETIVLARVVDNDKVVSSSSFTITKIDTTEPTISLDIPDEIVLKTEYNLPTSYSVDNTKSGGSAICKINDKEVTTTKDLEIGTYEITCIATTGAGKEVTITKTLNVKDEEIDIALELPDRILVGSSNPLPTSVIGSNYSCKVGDTQYQDTKDLEIGSYEITCSVVSIGGNKKEVTKQIEIYEEASTDTDNKDENDEIVGDDTNG